MAQGLNVRALASIALLASAGAIANEGPLADPMQPPQVRATESKASAVSASAREVRAIWSVGNKRFAIIEKDVLRVGSAVGDAQVTSISDTEVVLRGPEGLTTLRLTPEIEKQFRGREAAREPRRLAKPSPEK